VVRVDGRFGKTLFHYQGPDSAQYPACVMSSITS